MMNKLILSFVALIFISISANGQKPKVKASTTKTTTTTSQKSNPEKMGYERANKYWGPGTYYRYAPGEPTYKMANTALSDMRDLIGIWGEDFYKEIAKQGFVEVPKKEIKRWFNPNNNKEKRFFYSPDKSYILESGVRGLNESPEIDGKKPQVSTDACRIRLIAKEDTAQVMEAIWQYLRDLHDTKLILGSLGSNFKKAELKVNPIQRVGTAGWAGLRAGSFVLMMENGKPKSIYQSFDDIVRRTITKPEFDLRIMGAEQAFGYNLRVSLEKEGYILTYRVVSVYFKELEPGRKWESEYPTTVQEYQWGLKAEKEAIDVYKKAPMPPVLLDLNKVLHIK